MKLPPNTKLVREIAALPGWFAYYLDVEARALHQLPVVLWVTVEYEEAATDGGGGFLYDAQGSVVKDIRPFVLSRGGRVLDAHEPLIDFVDIVGPGVDQIAHVRKLVRARYPDLVWPGDEPKIASVGN